MKISVVVVGRDEGFKLESCLESLIHCRKVLTSVCLNEIIYVDSDSKDNSIDIARKLDIDTVVRVSGEINSAVARNIGASYAKNEWILFVDGDMDIQPAFFEEPITQEFLDKEDFFSGQFVNVYYDKEWNVEKRDVFKPNSKVTLDAVPGGLFLIRRKIWESLGGMKDYYRRTQDYEFGLRVYKDGYTFKRINKLLAVHHTVSDYTYRRMLGLFKNKGFLYARSLLYRDHIIRSPNKNCLRVFWDQDKTLLALIICIIAAFFVGPWAFLVYLGLISIRAIKIKQENFFRMFSYLLLRDVYVFFGLFFFWPKKKLNYTVEEIKIPNELVPQASVQ